MLERPQNEEAAAPAQGDGFGDGLAFDEHHGSNGTATPATEQTATAQGEVARMAPGHANSFLNFLGDGPFLFHTFDDDKDRKEPSLCKALYGSLEEHAEELHRFNAAGAGVFVTVNKTVGARRRAEDVTAVRAFILDLDGAPVYPVLEWELEPHLVVLSSPGRYHCYWKVEDAPCDVASYREVQKALLSRFSGDPNVTDLPRVMRLPGFIHRKDAPFRTEIIQWPNNRAPYTYQQFRTALAKPVRATRHETNGGNTDAGLFRYALSLVTAEGRDRWIAYAFHIKAELGEDDGWEAFLELSERSPDYKGEPLASTFAKMKAKTTPASPPS